MIFENNSPKGIFRQNMSDSPNWSLTERSPSPESVILKTNSASKAFRLIYNLENLSRRLYQKFTRGSFIHEFIGSKNEIRR